VSTLLLFYALVLVVIIAVVVFVYRLFARRSRVIATLLAVLLMSGLVLVWPIPIHGGFIFLGELLYRELSRPVAGHIDETRARRSIAPGRFAGELSFSVTERLSDRWQRVLVDGGLPVWHETHSHLLWSDWLGIDADVQLPSLSLAAQRCAQYPPAGYWSLVSEAENYLLWKSDARQWLPPAPVSSVAQLIDTRSGLVMAAYHMRNSNSNSGQTRSSLRPFVLRCVARGIGAPVNGYQRENIPLDEWNRFQLLKVLPGD